MLGRSATCSRREHYGETIVAGRASCEPRRRPERREVCRRYFSPSNNAGASSSSMIRLGGTPTTNDVSELWTDNSMEHSGIDIEEKKEAEDARSSSDDGYSNGGGGGAAAAAAPTDTRSRVRSSSSRAPDEESSRAAREPKKVPLRPPPGAPLRRSERVAGADTLTIPKDVAQVGDPQRKEEKSYSIETILKELQAIQNTGPRKYCILGTRHCSYLHQQIIELLSYALVLTGNHIFTSGSPGTNAAAIRGALRAERSDLLTVVLPQSLAKQPEESQELLEQVEDVIENARNDVLSLDVASRICNSDLLSRTEQLIAFAFHDSGTVIEATREAKSLDMVVTTLYLD